MQFLAIDNEVLVIESERLHRRQVQILHRGQDTVLVESGLQAGERVCLTPIAVFAEGMQVRLAGAGQEGGR